jgi:hypothetical protein
MLAAQGGVCAACGETPSPRRGKSIWNVDHDHSTGRVRGILCTGCNSAIGHLQDDPERCRKAAAYLERTVE